MEAWHGSFERSAAWSFYILMNLMAIYFNLSLIISIFRLKDRKTSTDVLIGGLCGGIIVGAMGCGPQCFLNLVLNTFAYGDRACFAEAFLHIVGMEIQFLNVAAISYRTYVGVVKLQNFSVQKAYVFVISSWFIAFIGTFIFGSYSDYYLVASGTFCFYNWTSIALLAWAWPLAGIAAVSMGYWYWKTFETVRRVRQSAKEIIVDGSTREVDVAYRLSTMVLLFLLGYSGIISQSLYEVFVGRAKIWGDVTAACIVLLYWVSAAFAYAHANQRLGVSGVLCCSPLALIKASQGSGGTRNSTEFPRAQMSQLSNQSVGNSVPGHKEHLELENLSSALDITSKIAEHSLYFATQKGTQRLEGNPCDPEDNQLLPESLLLSSSQHDGGSNETPSRSLLVPSTSEPALGSMMIMTESPTPLASPSSSPSPTNVRLGLENSKSFDYSTKSIFNPFVASPSSSSTPITREQESL